MTESADLPRRPVQEVLPGVTFVPLPEGAVVEAVFALIKTRDADGTTGWSWRSPEIVNHEEILGALISQTDWLRRGMLDQWEDLD